MVAKRAKIDRTSEFVRKRWCGRNVTVEQITSRLDDVTTILVIDHRQGWPRIVARRVLQPYSVQWPKLPPDKQRLLEQAARQKGQSVRQFIESNFRKRNSNTRIKRAVAKARKLAEQLES